jgi:hypothetical protein
MYAVAPPIVTGQTHHIFFGTDPKLGGIGLHYRIARANPFTNDEYREEDVERQVAITSISGADILNAAAGTFSAGDIGKLAENVAGLVIPAGTTVVEIISTSQVRLSNAVAGAAGTVTLVSYVGNRRRGVVLNWKPSDLVEETAWIYDFPPPSCSHATQVENRMWVAGWADAKAKAQETFQAPDSSASAQNPGTALIPSLPNHFESYDPRWPLYLPEQVVDMLSDGMEGYKFIGGQNGVYALQHLNVENGIPGTLTVLLRGEGIKTPKNWCARDRAIYLMLGEGPCRITEGGTVDKQFGRKVRNLMRAIAPQEQWVVQGHPRGQAVMYAARNVSFLFDEVTGRWSCLVALDDEYSGNIISAVATQSRLIITLEDGGSRSAYRYDEGSGSEYVSAIGHYQNTPAPEISKLVQRLTGAFVADRLDTHYAGIHINTLPTYINDAAIAAGSNVLQSSSGIFTDELIGSYVLVRRAGPGNGWLLARIIEILSPISCKLGTPVADLGQSVALSATNTVTAGYALIAYRIFPLVPVRKGTVEFDSQEMYLPGCFSYAVSIVQPTDTTGAQPLHLSLDGTLQPEGWTNPSAIFG